MFCGTCLFYGVSIDHNEHTRLCLASLSFSPSAREYTCTYHYWVQRRLLLVWGEEGVSYHFRVLPFGISCIGRIADASDRDGGRIVTTSRFLSFQCTRVNYSTTFDPFS